MVHFTRFVEQDNLLLLFYTCKLFIYEPFCWENLRSVTPANVGDYAFLWAGYPS